MSNLILVIPLLFFLKLIQGKLWSVGCGIVSSDGIYELKDLAKSWENPWSINTSSNETLEFNLCAKIRGCASNVTSIWAKKIASDGACENITSEGNPTKENVVSGIGKVIVVDYTKLGQTCPANLSQNYSFSLYVKCNKDIKKENASLSIISESQCGYSVMMEVENGCPIVSMSVIMAFITLHTPLFSVGFIVLGVALGIFGRSMWTTVIFGLVAFSCVVVSMIILYEYILPFDAPLWSLWVSFFASIGIGVTVACLTAKYDSVGFLLLGAWLGATSTIFLTNIYARCAFAAFVLYKLWGKNLVMGIVVAVALVVIPIGYTYVFNEITFWLCFAAITAVYAYAAYAIKDLLITIATSLLGSYLAVRGVSLILGGFPDEYQTFLQLKRGDFNVHSMVSLYVIIMLVLALGFIVVQEYMGKVQEEDKEPEPVYEEMQTPP